MKMKDIAKKLVLVNILMVFLGLNQVSAAYFGGCLAGGTDKSSSKARKDALASCQTEIEEKKAECLKLNKEFFGDKYCEIKEVNSVGSGYWQRYEAWADADCYCWPL